MNRALCPNNHYYDADRYASCPHCAKEGKDVEPEIKPDPITEPILGSWKNKFAKKKERGKNNDQEPRTEKPPIAGGGFTSDGGDGPEPQSEMVPPETGSGSASQPGGGSSLQNDIGKVNKGNEPKTMSYWGNNFEPPVGWFACIGGSNVGSTYEIYSGKNSIGRKKAAENEIIIQQDAKISGIKHTTVMYDPKGRKFYLLPGEGNGMVYRNDEIILNITELSAHDILQIGDTSLMLFPLCGPDFTWEDWIKESNE